jgi:hypothetical protein
MRRGLDRGSTAFLTRSDQGTDDIDAYVRRPSSLGDGQDVGAQMAEFRRLVRDDRRNVSRRCLLVIAIVASAKTKRHGPVPTCTISASGHYKQASPDTR